MRKTPLLVFLMAVVVPAWSQNDTGDAAKDQAEVEGLKVADYKTLPIIVLEIEPNDAKITEQTVKGDAESLMKAADLAVTSEPKDHFLLISVHVEGAAFYIDVGFYRQASWDLPDGKVAHNFLETWNAGDALGTHNNTDGPILKELNNRLGLFLSTYLKVNQPKK